MDLFPPPLSRGRRPCALLLRDSFSGFACGGYILTTCPLQHCRKGSLRFLVSRSKLISVRPGRNSSLALSCSNVGYFYFYEAGLKLRAAQPVSLQPPCPTPVEKIWVSGNTWSKVLRTSHKPRTYSAFFATVGSHTMSRRLRHRQYSSYPLFQSTKSAPSCTRGHSVGKLWADHSSRHETHKYHFGIPKDPAKIQVNIRIQNKQPVVLVNAATEP